MRYQSLEYVPVGKWLCPESGEVVVTDQKIIDRYDKETRKVLGSRHRNP